MIKRDHRVILIAIDEQLSRRNRIKEKLEELGLEVVDEVRSVHPRAGRVGVVVAILDNMRKGDVSALRKIEDEGALVFRVGHQKSGPGWQEIAAYAAAERLHSGRDFKTDARAPDEHNVCPLCEAPTEGPWMKNGCGACDRKATFSATVISSLRDPFEPPPAAKPVDSDAKEWKELAELYQREVETLKEHLRSVEDRFRVSEAALATSKKEEEAARDARDEATARANRLETTTLSSLREATARLKAENSALEAENIRIRNELDRHDAEANILGAVEKQVTALSTLVEQEIMTAVEAFDRLLKHVKKMPAKPEKRK